MFEIFVVCTCRGVKPRCIYPQFEAFNFNVVRLGNEESRVSFREYQAQKMHKDIENY